MKIKHKHPSLLPRRIMKFEVKAMNDIDTIELYGLVSSRLVFGILPKILISSTDLQSQNDRMEALATAQAEMNSIVGKSKNLLLYHETCQHLQIALITLE